MDNLETLYNKVLTTKEVIREAQSDLQQTEFELVKELAEAREFGLLNVNYSRLRMAIQHRKR